MNEDKGWLDPKDAFWEKVEEVSVLITPFWVSPVPEYIKLTGKQAYFILSGSGQY